MKFIKSKWRIITLIYLFISYIILITILKLPFSAYLTSLALFILILSLIFIGTFIGTIGVFVQLITKKQHFVVHFYKLAYRLKTENTSILASYGLILLRERAYVDALDCFKYALTTTNHFLTVKTLKGNKAICYWKLNNISKAIDTYKDIIYQYGKTNQDFISNPDYSDRTIEKFLQDNPYLYPQDCVTIGYLYLQKKDYEKATFFTNVALKLSPNYSAAYDNLGQISFTKDDLSTGKMYFEKALEINPRLADSLYYMGLIAFKQNDSYNARIYLKKAQNLSLDGLDTITYTMIENALDKL